MCFTDIIYLTRPIGWNELGVVATVAAVIVALRANRKAAQQLQSSLDMQEQSKNVALLDRRVDLAEEIQSKNPVSELILQVLFNEEILKHYRAWRAYIKERISAGNDLDHFFSVWLQKLPDDSVRMTIRKYEFDLDKPDCPEQLFSEYETYCNDHIFWEKSGEEKQIAYNYLEIEKRLDQAIKEAKKENELTVQLIKEFITDSIKKVS